LRIGGLRSRKVEIAQLSKVDLSRNQSPELQKRDIMTVAQDMIGRFGLDAAAKTESWSVFNRRAGEEEAAQFWNDVAKAIRELQKQAPAAQRKQ
jgi:hypothetical protein